MKVLVLGAGVIGVATAYYLSKHGFEVTVIDRQPGPALEQASQMPAKSLLVTLRHGLRPECRSKLSVGCSTNMGRWS